MHTTQILAAAMSIVALLPISLAAQVNFYYDENCQQYAGHQYPSPNGATLGGPWGSKSMLWVEATNTGPNCGVTGSAAFCHQLLFCKNDVCSASDISAGTYKCKSFQNGVYAREVCVDCQDNPGACHNCI